MNYNRKILSIPILAVLTAGILLYGCGGTEANSRDALIDSIETCPDRAAEFVAHYTCLGEVLGDVLDREGGAAGISAMHELVSKYPLMASACHQASHYAGRNIKNLATIESILRDDDGTCDFGLTHGMVEGLADIEGDTEFSDSISAVCQVVPDGVRRYNCAHGIGHALALRTKGDVRELMGMCNDLNTKDQTGCVTAAAMAYTSNAASFADDVAIQMPRVSNEELTKMCTELDGEARSSCWQMVASMLDTEGVEDLEYWGGIACEVAARSEMGERCGNGYGQAMYFKMEKADDLDAASIEANFTGAIEKCPKGASYIPCVVGVSGAAAGFWGAERDNFEGYPDLCGRLDTEAREACLVPEEQWRDNLTQLDRG